MKNNNTALNKLDYAIKHFDFLTPKGLNKIKRSIIRHIAQLSGMIVLLEKELTEKEKECKALREALDKAQEQDKISFLDGIDGIEIAA